MRMPVMMRKETPLPVIIALAGVVVAVWLAIGAPRTTATSPAQEAGMACASAGLPHHPGPAPRQAAGVTPDPRFVRRVPPTVPVALSPEARKMALEIQNKYRCAHCCADETAPRCLPGLGGDAGQDPQALVDALRKSLGSLPNDCYVSTALPKIIDPETPEDLMDVLYQDLLKRPNPIKLRMLFIIAETDGHPLAASALRSLQTSLNMDHQQDWPRWEQAVTQVCAHEERGMRSDNCRIH